MNIKAFTRNSITVIAAIAVIVVVSVQSASAQTPVYDFGGMYDQDTVNPLTGSNSCPSGYTDRQVLTRVPPFDSTLHYCYRDASISGGMEMEFGGITAQSSQTINNPYTGNTSCPLGYTKSTAFGPGMSGNEYYPGDVLYYCYKDVSSVNDSARLQNDFGGMSGVIKCSGGAPLPHTSPSCYAYIPVPEYSSLNPSTNDLLSCPTGYSNINVGMSSLYTRIGLSEPGVTDTNLRYCIPIIPTVSFIDIGLRIAQYVTTNPADGVEIVPIAVEPLGTRTYPLSIAKSGNVYSVALVDPSDPAATKALIRLSSGVTKALRRFTP